MSREPHDIESKWPTVDEEFQLVLQDRVRDGIKRLDENVPGWRPWFAKLLRKDSAAFEFSLPSCCIIGNVGKATLKGELVPLQVEVTTADELEEDDFWQAGRIALGFGAWGGDAIWQHGFDHDGEYDIYPGGRGFSTKKSRDASDIYAYLEHLWRDAIAGRFK